MKIRKVLLLGSVAVVTAVSAQAGVGVVSFGRGVAINVEGVRAEFRYEVGRRPGPNPNQVVPFGNFHFEVGRNMRVVVERVSRVASQGNVCEFGGEGWLVRPATNAAQPHRIPVRVMVRVKDNWNPTAPSPTPGPIGPPAGGPFDEITVRCFPLNTSGANAQPAFVFDGLVKRGNLVVRMPSAPPSPTP